MLHFPNCQSAQAGDVALQREKIVLAGSAWRCGPRASRRRFDFAVARLESNGRLDRSFSHNGRVETGFGAHSADGIGDIAIQPDGKIVAVGGASPWGFADPARDDDIAVVRYRRNGRLDRSFSGSGKLRIDFPGPLPDSAGGVALQPNGRIVVAGEGNGSPAFVRLLPAGALDPSFSGDGMVTFETGDERCQGGLSGVALQPGGRILASGDIHSAGIEGCPSPIERSFLVRVLSDGTPDPQFGSNGEVDGTCGGAPTLALDSEGRILAPRGAMGEEDFNVRRCLPDGSFDTSFSSDGTAAAYDRNVSADVSDVLPAGERVVVVGSTQPCGPVSGRPQPECLSRAFTLARFRSDGSLDSSFSRNGIVRTDFVDKVDHAFAAALQGDGRLVAAGFAVPRTNFGIRRFAVARFEGG